MKKPIISNRLLALLIGVSVLLWGVALYLPALVVTTSNQLIGNVGTDYSGLECLVNGMIFIQAIIFSVLGWAWLANTPWIILLLLIFVELIGALFARKNHGPSFNVAGSLARYKILHVMSWAVVIAVLLLPIYSFTGIEKVSLQIGAWMWIAALLIPAIAIVVARTERIGALDKK